MMPARFRFWTTTAALIAAAIGAAALRAGEPAPQPDLVLTADSPLKIDLQTRETVARDNARLVWGKWTLTADEVRFNQTTRVARATGHVIVSRVGFRLLADSVTYDLKTEHLEMFGFRFGQPPLHASGRHAFGDAEKITFEDVDLVYGDPGILAPRGSAAKLILFKDEHLEAEGLRLAIGSIPIAAATGIARPLELPELHWETRTGYDSELGVQLGVGAYLPTAKGFFPGGSVDIFTSRGLLFGPGARYDAALGNSTLSGSTDLAYIRDSGERGSDSLGRPIDKDRWFWNWEHIQRSGDRWTLNGELNWWSDSAVYRDFRDDLFDRNHDPDNFLEASWNGSSYVLSAFTRFRPNDFQIVPERLPEIRFDLLPTPLADTGALLEVRASAAALVERSLDDTLPDRHADRFDVYTGLSRTLKVARGVTVTPVVGGRLTHYARVDGGRDDYTRWLGEVGFDARLRASRVQELKNPLWGIDGLRHVIEPRIEYRFVPSANKGRAFIPEIDRPAFLTQMQPLGLADRRDIDALGKIDTVRFAVANVLEARRADYGSRQLLRFDLATDFTFDAPAGERDFSDVQAELQLTPADWLEWWFFLRFDPEDPNLREFNTRLVLVDAEAWKLGIDGDYLQDDIEQVQVFGRYAVNEANEFFGAVRYDAREHRFNEIQAGIATRLAQNWQLRAGVSFRDGPRRESSFGLKLDLRFIAF
jgi:LPS-assembly protein